MDDVWPAILFLEINDLNRMEKKEFSKNEIKDGAPICVPMKTRGKVSGGARGRSGGC